jgi:rod shape-determining protein MreB
MIGRTPKFVEVIKPLEDGVVSNAKITQGLIKGFIEKITRWQLLRPRIIISVPSYVTEVESRAIVDIAIATGSRNIHLLEEPISAVMGAGVDVSQSLGTLVIDIGGGTTDVAIVSLNGIVDAISIKTAGNRIDQALVKYMANRHKLSIGMLTAENLKIRSMNVFNSNLEKNIRVKGVDMFTNLPKVVTVSEAELALAISEYIMEIVTAVRTLLERANPNLIADICKHGAIMTGGGSLLKGLDSVLSKKVNVQCRVAENPIECVALGTAIASKNKDKLLDGFEHIKIKHI